MAGLSLSPAPGALSIARNLWPMPGSQGRTRPAAYQLYALSCIDAVPWGADRWLVNRGGHWRVITTGGSDVDLGGAVGGLSGTAFQALTGGGVRTDRLYFCASDAVLRYAEDASGYTLNAIVNEVLDGGGSPYPLNPARSVTTWRGRLWTEELTNRVSHSMNDLPHSWDPLHTLEFQTGRKDATTCLQPAGSVLAVGCLDAVWQVSGDSPYNWQRTQLVDGRGAVGARAMASDGERLWHVDEKGVYQIGRTAPLSEPLDELFDTPDYDAQLELDPGGEHLWLLLHGRVFVCLLQETAWGEMDFPGTVLGFWRSSDEIGFYGTFGLWVLSSEYLDSDVFLFASSHAILTHLETWDTANPQAERQLLRRVLVQARGAEDATATYTAIADGVDASSETFSLSDGASPPPVSGPVPPDLLDAVPVVRELSPLVAGVTLRHRIEAESFVEIVSLTPRITSRDHV